MARFVYSVTMSVDGFIAGPDGDMSWMVPYLGPDPAMDAFIAEVGAVLVGGGTMRGRDPYEGTEGEGEVFGGGWEGPQIAVTSQPPAGPVPGLTSTSDLDEGIGLARDVLLGDGTRLFSHPGGTHVRLEPITVAHIPLATMLRYRVVH